MHEKFRNSPEVGKIIVMKLEFLIEENKLEEAQKLIEECIVG